MHLITYTLLTKATWPSSTISTSSITSSRAGLKLGGLNIKIKSSEQLPQQHCTILLLQQALSLPMAHDAEAQAQNYTMHMPAQSTTFTTAALHHTSASKAR
jgi:hypothetical protein